MHRVAACLAAWMLATASGSALAQVSVVAPSMALRCLTRGDVRTGLPTFPEAAYESKVQASVKVDLEFLASDAPPRVLRYNVEPERTDYKKEFERSVIDFIQAYRVPCLPLGERTQLRLEFLFVPSDGRPVTLMAASDPEAARAERLRRCISHMRPKQTPDYPVFDVRREHQGTAVVRMEFSDRESPPRVSVLDEGGSASFGTTAAEHATGFRLPCHDGAGPVPVLTLYVFKLAGASRVVLRDLPLLTLVRSFRGVRQANVYFDFNAMGCPFDVHFSPMQPHAPNWVGEVGNPHPERRFFLDWLSRQEFDLDPVQVNQVLGQQAVVSVPCTVLNLGSRTGGGASQ